MKMEFITAGFSSLLSLILMVLLCPCSCYKSRSRRQITDVIHFNETGCNQIIEVDGLATSRTLNLSMRAKDCLGCPEKNVTCQNKCVVTYTTKSQFVRNAYKFCGRIYGLFINCDLEVTMAYSYGGKTNSRRFSCEAPLFKEYCAPTSRDLQVSLETNFCEKNGYVRLKLKPVFSNTYELQYPVARCSRFPTTLNKEKGSIMSHVPLDSQQNVCGVYLNPYFFKGSNEVVKFCIEFMDYQFLQGGPKLRITIEKDFDEKMIFDSTHPVPKGKICNNWLPFSPIMVIVEPGENPNIKQHSFLFHYSFKKEELRKSWSPNDDDDDDDDEDEDNGPNIYSIVFGVFFTICFVGVVCTCLTKRQKRNMQGNRSSEAADSSEGNVQPTLRFVNSPSNMDSAIMHPTLEMNNRTAGSRTFSPSSTNETRPTMPPAPLDWNALPSYESLFPDEK